MEFSYSAGKHGIGEEDVLHALRNVVRYWESEYEGEARVFAIGPDRTGRMLELVVVPASNPQRVIHADILRPKFYYR